MPIISVVSSGSNVAEIKESVKKSVHLIGGMSQIVKRGDTVLIKPNFVAPFPKATTNLNVLGEIVEEVRDCGAKPIIGESSGFEFDTEATFDIIAAKEFARDLDVKLLNLEKQDFERIKVDHGIIKEMMVSKIALEVDVLINVPKMKMHKVTTVSFGMKNLIGILDRESRRKIHIFGIDSAIVALNKVVKSDITIVDGLTVIKSAAVYGNSIKLGVIVSGKDIVSVDQVCCDLMSIDPSNIQHIERAMNSEATLRDEMEIRGDYENITRIRMDKEERLLKLKISRTSYQSMHLLDYFYSRVFWGKTLIPYLNWKFGVRPEVLLERCNRCGICIEVCPVHAIDEKTIQIDYKKCMYVRCLKCVEICPLSAIKAEGFGQKT